MTVSSETLEHVQDLLAWVPAIRAQRMFGGAGLYSGDRMFAIVVDDDLYLKADTRNAPLYRDGGGEKFRYARAGQTHGMNYWLVPGEIFEDPEALETWTRAALDAAFRAPPKRSK